MDPAIMWLSSTMKQKGRQGKATRWPAGTVRLRGGFRRHVRRCTSKWRREGPAGGQEGPDPVSMNPLRPGMVLGGGRSVIARRVEYRGEAGAR